ncbi:major facilitator superfamily domain-containing protein [Geranomyces variabilis]|nr:major facilitator superfamily domain-containing protein [Geranomyces variabilis]KAJ3138129.1 hypothetical protein HDU90_001612 [Geranomyces variabilis]
MPAASPQQDPPDSPSSATSAGRRPVFLTAQDSNPRRSNATLRISESNPDLEQCFDNHDDDDGENRRRVGAADIFRTIALGCAILLAFGSHFAGVSFGTLKTAMRKELQLSNTQYAVAQASNDLMGTFVPLLAGIFFDMYGTGLGSVVTTTTIFVGTLLVASAASASSYSLLVIGRVVYGVGAGSVNVVQQTIVARAFQQKHLPLAMAALLLVNRVGTVIGNSVVVPIMDNADHWSWSLWVTAIVAGASLLVNLGYIVLWRLSRNRSSAAGVVKDASITSRKTAFDLKSLFYLSQTFWLIILIHFLAVGVMNSFLGFSTDLIKQRFKGSTAQAAYKTTISLAVPLVLYFCLGPLFERFGHRVSAIFVSSGVLTLFCVFIGFTDIDPIVSMVLLAISIAFKGLASLTAIPLVVPATHLGTAFAIYRCATSISSAILDLMVGKVQDNTPGETYDRVMAIFIGLSGIATLLSVAFIIVDRVVYGGVMQWNDKKRKPIVEQRRREEELATKERRDVLVSSSVRGGGRGDGGGDGGGGGGRKAPKASLFSAALFFASAIASWAVFFAFTIPSVADSVSKKK